MVLAGLAMTMALAAAVEDVPMQTTRPVAPTVLLEEAEPGTGSPPPPVPQTGPASKSAAPAAKALAPKEPPANVVPAEEKTEPKAGMAFPDKTSTQEAALNYAVHHCQSWLGSNPEGGVADMGFVLGEYSETGTDAQRMEFSRLFGNHLINHYNLDVKTSGCGFEVVEMKTSGGETVSGPAGKDRYEYRTVKQQEAFLRTRMNSTRPDVPVNVVYHLVSKKDGPWVLANISINGQPQADRYRGTYRQILRQGGMTELLASLKTSAK